VNVVQRTNVSRLRLLLIAALAAIYGYWGNEGDASALEGAITVTGYGSYCSKTWGDGAWAFNYDDTTASNPCLKDDPQGMGTTQRRGLFSINEWNDVVVKCVGMGDVTFTRVGAAALNEARQAVSTQLHSSCIFTVSPRKIPIFDAPFAGTKLCGTGFDHSRRTTQMKNYLGEEAKWNIDNHEGIDWGIAANTPLTAVASGRVVKAMVWINTGCPDKSIEQIERKVFILHSACNAAGFCEKFVSYYDHLNLLAVATNQLVTKGQVIGKSGNSACVPEHLHFGVMRLTNTSDKLLEDFDIEDRFLQATIDPYGWRADWVDPRGWEDDKTGDIENDNGAISVNLWNEGKAPQCK